ncbi:cytochrome P450 9e2-like [Hylaeus volcanicus]|uniref:cytochrome P450 9e2-like n=1 Tax=Hylaeus volcanicus TaxID=313075 RepID=UPI0023B80E7C|nr:cytochrome P450 9e2-like [Hylaeus volcanicus]
MVFTCFAFVAGGLTVLVVYLINKYSYWKRQGIPTAKGVVPWVGHMLPVLTLRTTLSQLVRKMYEENKNHSMIGFYKIRSPVLVVREPQLIKTIMQSNFSSFHKNAMMTIHTELDPLLAKNPFFMNGEGWTITRRRFTYAFSGLRLKMLFGAVSGVCKKFEDFLQRRLQATNKYEVELKSLFSRFTGEVVANAGFGVEGYCMDDESQSKSFDQLGKAMLEPNLKNAIANTIISFVPELSKVLKIAFVPKKVDRFVRNVISENLEMRRKSSIPRNDFLQVMIDLDKSEGKTLDDEQLTADALSFYLDGYETSSITLSFVGYQLATHPDVQEKLRNEITSTIAKHGGTLTFDALKDMTYMDQVISESQRLFPAVGVISKQCTEEFELQGSDGLCFRVKPGTVISIPIYALHTDPEYWPDPQVFDPERFSNDRKQSIQKMTFLPFGEGPRICLGMRIAILQMKACIATLVRSYKLELSPKTQLPLQLYPTHILAAPVGGLWVNISKI